VPSDLVEEWVTHLSEEYLECRDLGHAWRSWSARHHKRERYYERVIRCTRCESERVQYLSQHGVVEGGHYRYAKGYLMPHGVGGFTAEVRARCHLAAVTAAL